jgi:hypothetical protein
MQLFHHNTSFNKRSTQNNRILREGINPDGLEETTPQLPRLLSTRPFAAACSLRLLAATSDYLQ